MTEFRKLIIFLEALTMLWNIVEIQSVKLRATMFLQFVYICYPK